MLSSFSKLIYYPRLPFSVIKQQYLFASSSSSKGDSTSPSTGDTYEDGKKDIHDPEIDSSHQSGTKSKKERIKLENKEQGVASRKKAREERKTPDQNEHKNIK